MFLKAKQVEDINSQLIEAVNPFLIMIFGSFVKGNIRDDSDIDIAFLSNKNVDELEIFIVAQKLADVLKRDVDLINLNIASTVFRAQIIGTGKVIYCSDERQRMNFMVRALKEYALLNEERAVILEKIKERGKVYG